MARGARWPLPWRHATTARSSAPTSAIRLSFNIPPCSCQLRRNSAPERLNCRGPVLLAENGRSRDENRGAGGNDARRCRRIDASVDLDLHPDPVFLNHLSYTTYLGHHRFDERLTAEPRVDGHDQDKVTIIDGRGEDFGRGGGVDGDSRLRSPVPD